MQTWEYTLERSTEWIGQALLNSYGREGWEFVTVLFDGQYYNSYISNGQSA